MSDTKLQIQGAQRIPSRINASKPTSNYIIFELQKNQRLKKTTLKEGRGRIYLSYRGTKIKITFNPSEAKQARGGWSEIIKA